MIMSVWVMGRNITIKGKVNDGYETSPANDQSRVGLMALKIGAQLKLCINPLSVGLC